MFPAGLSADRAGSSRESQLAKNLLPALAVSAKFSELGVPAHDAVPGVPGDGLPRAVQPQPRTHLHQG